MRIIRYQNENAIPTLASVTEELKVHVLPYADFLSLVAHAKEQTITPLQLVERVLEDSAPLEVSLEELQLLVPIEAPEVWAAGVTYERSRDARNYEATGGKLDATTFYDKVYDAERPEIFFKSTAARTVGPNADIYLRSDSNWQIPEPEVGLVLSGCGEVLGYTIGNDMSCRDVEGDNPLYLPQAKIWRHSCSIGPAILLADAVADPYDFEIVCRIFRGGEKVVEGSAKTSQLKRRFDDLVAYLCRDNIVFDGTVLLTGTCIVPPNEFTLTDGDEIEIAVSGIGVLRNPVKQQKAAKKV